MGKIKLEGKAMEYVPDEYRNEFCIRRDRGFSKGKEIISNIEGLNSDVAIGRNVSNPEEIISQIDLLGIPYINRIDVIDDISCMAVLADTFDNFLDSPSVDPNFELMYQYRYDIPGLLDASGNVGELGRRILNFEGADKKGLEKALQRLVFGTLIQLSPHIDILSDLAQEHRALVIPDINSELASKLRDKEKIGNIEYWTTTKAGQQFFFSLIGNLNQDLAEANNCVMAPARYYYNVIEEYEAGEMKIPRNMWPRVDRMINLMEVGAKYISDHRNGNINLKARQIEAAREVYKSSNPWDIDRAYRNVVKLFQPGKQDLRNIKLK